MSGWNIFVRPMRAFGASHTLSFFSLPNGLIITLSEFMLNPEYFNISDRALLFNSIFYISQKYRTLHVVVPRDHVTWPSNPMNCVHFHITHEDMSNVRVVTMRRRDDVKITCGAILCTHFSHVIFKSRHGLLVEYHVKIIPK